MKCNKRIKRLTDEQKIEIVEKYKTGKYTCAGLGREYGRDYNSISRMLKRRGVEICTDKTILSKKYSYNDHFFDIIDTEEKAYFLGLFAADGYNNEKQNCCRISLQEGDKDILEKFVKALASNRPIRFIESKNKKYSNMCEAAVNSKQISRRLKELGCPQAKSLILEFPTEEQVPKYLLRHWIAGLFDGDGCFCRILRSNRKNSYACSFVSTIMVCEGLKRFLEQELDIYCGIFYKNNTTASLNISGRMQCYKFLDFIYKDSTVYMNRKYNKYLSEMTPPHLRPKLPLDSGETHDIV